MRSYFEEYERKYEKPRMGKTTVGFSGIDPAPQYGTEDVQEILSRVGAIDCGEIT